MSERPEPLEVGTPAQITGAPVSPPEAFWGRSPAAKWRLYLEQDALSKGDLSGVTEIVISLAYKAFIPSLQSAKAEVEAVFAG